MVSIKCLLPRAFDRIDRAKKVRDTQKEIQVAKVFGELFPVYAGRYAIALRGSTIVVGTESGALRHKIYTSQEKIIQLLNDLPARSIAFTSLKR